MALTIRATLVPPDGGITGERSAADLAQLPARAPRCLRLVERTNGIKLRPADQCPSERLPGVDYCVGHLAGAVEQYNAIVAAHALGSGAPHPSDTRYRDLCSRCGRPHPARDCDT
jgi:hypothetical protein